MHFPTDLNLLWDAARKSVDLVARLSESCGLGGWRKAKHWKRKIKGQMRLVGKISQGGGKNKAQRVRQAASDYVVQAGELENKVQESLETLKPRITEPVQWILFEEVEYFHQMLIKLTDLVQRRLVQGETIGHEEKVFSLFEEHTEWITKGKRRAAVELGHKLLVTTDQYDLVLDYKVMEKSQNAQETLELTRGLFEAYGEEAFGSMSFDKGFCKTTDRQQLEKVVPLVVMPKKGRLSEEDRQRESSRQFVRFKNRHSAIESNINTLEHHGLNRCPDKGLGGYKRYVGFGVLAYNLHRIGAQRLRRQRDQRPGKRPLKRAA